MVLHVARYGGGRILGAYHLTIRGPRACGTDVPPQHPAPHCNCLTQAALAGIPNVFATTSAQIQIYPLEAASASAGLFGGTRVCVRRPHYGPSTRQRHCPVGGATSDDVGHWYRPPRTLIYVIPVFNLVLLFCTRNASISQDRHCTIAPRLLLLYQLSTTVIIDS